MKPPTATAASLHVDACVLALSLRRTNSTPRSALGAGAAVRALLQAAASALPDALAILIGAVALSLFGGARPGGAARELDLAAYAWIPYLAVRLLAALAATALQRPLPPAVEHGV